jgi:hypothetical protein
MAQTVQEVLQKATFYTDGIDYRLIHLPPNAITAAASVVAEVGEAFLALIVDKDEVTLVLDSESLMAFGKRLRQYRAVDISYRLITLDVELEPTLTGLMAHLSTALAKAGISILPYAAFARDHLLVPAAQFDLAMTTLQQLKSG